MKTTSFRTLLVEEDAELASATVEALHRSNFECHHVLDATTALAAFKSATPHLVLLSLGLPRIGGAVLCAPIRAISHVPVVILSVRTRREDHLHALNLGADEFITLRPFDEQIMMARVLTLMRRVYHYNQPEESEPLAAMSLPKPQAQLPAGWVTCEFCSYMGPQGRFHRLNSQGQPAVLCPHCDRSQNLVYSVA